jgi:hypothetical protein
MPTYMFRNPEHVHLPPNPPFIQQCTTTATTRILYLPLVARDEDDEQNGRYGNCTIIVIRLAAPSHRYVQHCRTGSR